jgi:cell division protein FtsZ
VVAKLAKEAGALTLAIVTRPFTFEGKKRTENAIQGLTNLKAAVDSVIIVSNDKLLTSSGGVPVDKAFQESDRILAQSVKTVADLILVPAMINLDFADVKSTLKDSGISLIGFGMGKGPNKAEEAALNAINSPLLEAHIQGAKRAICAVTCGSGVTMYEAQKCVTKIVDEAGGAVDIKFGVSINSNLDDSLVVSVIASDFDNDKEFIAAPPVDLTPITPTIDPQAQQAMEEKAQSEFGPDIDLSDELRPNFGND